ncbi:MAG: hypothetical protein BWY77_00098 [bacterium ADurb.Bin431]|nr:MAG: hypothetical protein BWY77_00098 [bacterium ADurb.Bin431]
MVSKLDYGEREVAASRSVLIELIHILGVFRDDMVIVGGSVPPLLFPDAADQYVGTLDVDIALNPHRPVESYANLRSLLLQHGYREHGEQPFIFYRDLVQSDGATITVQVDFLSGEYGGTGKTHRTQVIQDVRARKARGCDLAFNNSEQVTIEGILPEGGMDHVSCKISAIVPFLVMKAMALAERMKEKDAWDIYFCILHYPPGLDALIVEIKSHLGSKLVVEGMAKISEKFQSPDYIGPKLIADFEGITDPEERARIQRDAFERIDYILRCIGIRI